LRFAPTAAAFKLQSFNTRGLTNFLAAGVAIEDVLRDGKGANSAAYIRPIPPVRRIAGLR
jgi:hypothetical protein